MGNVLFTILSIFVLPQSSEPKNDFTTLKNVKLGQRGFVKWLGRLTRKTVYSGLGKEKFFNGTIADANDYVSPRYVYADLTESEEICRNHGAVIGYRISPTLVIHSMVGTNYLKSEVDEFIKEFGGKMLNSDDVNVLRKNISVISKMRKAIGDTYIPKGVFWAMPYGNVVEAVHAVTAKKDDEGAKIANIILKR